MKGQLSINRVTGGHKHWIGISLTDELSGVECVQISISPEAFGNCVTGLSHQDCEFEWRPKHVGKRLECMTQNIPCESNPKDKDKDAVLKPFEVDGWSARRSDLGNYHRRTKNGYNVVFHRWVDP